jgi:hypothetical protein
MVGVAWRCRCRSFSFLLSEGQFLLHGSGGVSICYREGTVNRPHTKDGITLPLEAVSLGCGNFILTHLSVESQFEPQKKLFVLMTVYWPGKVRALQILE